MKKKPVKKASRKIQHTPTPAGRPKFAVNLKMRKRVLDMVGCKVSHEDIARAIGCTPPTLKLYFAEELKIGEAILREEALALIIKSARKGNVSAQRKFISLTHGGDLGDENMKFSSTKYEDGAVEVKSKTKKEKLGKKELQQQEAEEHDEDFSPPKAPRLVVDNKK